MADIADIDGILGELDDVVAWSVRDQSRLGIFAHVYRAVTAAIRSAVVAGEFEDNMRMIRLDVAFARLYLDALSAFRSDERLSYSWRVAFEAGNKDVLIIQQLMLGMNAHINLDLAIAAASVAPGAEVDDMKNDFMAVNRILWGLTNRMQEKLGRVSPLLFLLDWIGKRRDEQIIDFSIEKARQHAWNLARDMAFCDATQREQLVSDADRHIGLLGTLIERPPGRLIPLVLSLVRRFESRDIDEILAAFGD